MTSERPVEPAPLAWSDPALERALAAIREAFGAINRLPHDERAGRWVEAQGHLNEAYKILQEGA